MKLEHVALWVRDLEAARAFFKKFFGAASPVSYYNPKTGLRSCFLAFADGGRLELMSLPPLADAAGAEERRGYAHLALSLGSREAVDALTRRLTEDGYPCISGPRWTGDGYYESCLRGFEGNLLELTL